MYKEIQASQLNENVFSMIGKQWTLITAEDNGHANTMTASWGGLGVIWNKNVVTVYVRPQRYTKSIMDKTNTFSLTFFDEEYRNMLQYMGKASGKDEDKIKHENLHLIHELDTPYFEEARVVILCKKLYSQDMRPECFDVKDMDHTFYPQKDYHTLYIGEITKILIKE